VRERVDDILQRLASQEVRVTGLAADSRTIATGEVFLAYPGFRHDGRNFIPGALERGAAAVVWERAGFEWNPDWKVPNLGVDGVHGLAGLLAHEVYGRPSERLWTIGVTGTNGKTTCSQWIAQACGACGARTAVLGTSYGFPPTKPEDGTGPNTTPDRSIGRWLRVAVAEKA
jgi:UDP-N-acetylmuramoyl-L-alanyl-D-glutamate--2,6-diaminopimelate ligase